MEGVNNLQTFLPYQSFTKSLECLDDKRLGKQRVEAMQILNALEPGSTSRWKNHPAVKMWESFEHTLKFYHDIAIVTWINRGFRNSMKYRWFGSFTDPCDEDHTFTDRGIFKPPWLTHEFCAAHRSNLLRKDPEFYGKYNWAEPPDLPYIWPVQ